MGGRSAVRLAFLCLLAASGCASRAVAPLTAPQHDFAEAEDEATLLRTAEETEGELRAHALVVRDPAVQAYVDGVLRKVAPAGLGARAPRVWIVRSSLPNAWALPNGTILISTGMLVLLEDEAQLALVLGHEVAHYTNRHFLSGQRDRDSKAVAAAIANVALLGMPLANTAYLAAVTSYHRDQEEQADRDGLEWTTRAGYDPRAASEFYLVLERAAGPGAVGESLYDTHPSLQSRAAYTRQLLATGALHPVASPVVGAEPYRAAVAPLRRENVELLLAARSFTAAEEEADAALAILPDAAVFHCYKGEAQRGAADDPEFVALERALRAATEVTDAGIAAEAARSDERRRSALAHYRRCLEGDPREPLAHRGIGIVSRQTGDLAGARDSLHRYLELQPAAYDRRWILLLLAEDGS